MSNQSDTNQASELFELCKKVYERTKWQQKGTRMIFNDADDGAGLYKHFEGYLYTSDYLLEKLPSFYFVYKGQMGNTWYIGQITGGHTIQTPPWIYDEFTSDTPLLALLKLTIALSEAGELNE